MNTQQQIKIVNLSHHGSFARAVNRPPIAEPVKNPFVRWLASFALGHSSRGLEHSTTLARFMARCAMCQRPQRTHASAPGTGADRSARGIIIAAREGK
jgi:hypothetical protein